MFFGSTVVGDFQLALVSIFPFVLAIYPINLRFVLRPGYNMPISAEINCWNGRPRSPNFLLIGSSSGLLEMNNSFTLGIIHDGECQIITPVSKKINLVTGISMTLTTPSIQATSFFPSSIYRTDLLWYSGQMESKQLHIIFSQTLQYNEFIILNSCDGKVDCKTHDMYLVKKARWNNRPKVDNGTPRLQ